MAQVYEMYAYIDAVGCLASPIREKCVSLSWDFTRSF